METEDRRRKKFWAIVNRRQARTFIPRKQKPVPAEEPSDKTTNKVLVKAMNKVHEASTSRDLRNPRLQTAISNQTNEAAETTSSEMELL